MRAGRTLVATSGLAAIAAAGFWLFSGGFQAEAVGALPHRDDLTPEDRVRVVAVTALPTEFSQAQRFEAMMAGAATYTGPINRKAFTHIAPNIEFDDRSDWHLGDALFERPWVTAPSSTLAADGLGPLFNARSCVSCHVGDGRGHPPADHLDTNISMLLRLSVPPRTEVEMAALASGEVLAIPDPNYGGQLQDLAVPGLQSEGRMQITYTEEEVVLADGETVSLRRPSYEIANLGYGEPDPELMISPRVAPPMIGLGLIEAIHPGDLLALEDPGDVDGDGISGRAHWVQEYRTGEPMIGRFGWKATNPTLRQQNAEAFAGDIGMSTPALLAHHGDCTEQQTDCLSRATGVQEHLGASELPDPILELVTYFTANLAVPRRRDVDDPEVLLGKQHFHDLGCASCHRPSFVTSRDAEIAAHRFQLIWPYSDFLLHDMGEGLADDRPVGQASGREWRTPPLWGIGLTETVNGHTYFLHDGRARNLLEAILWHGGEAQAARDGVVALATQDRNALIRFLETL